MSEPVIPEGSDEFDLSGQLPRISIRQDLNTSLTPMRDPGTVERDADLEPMRRRQDKSPALRSLGPDGRPPEPQRARRDNNASKNGPGRKQSNGLKISADPKQEALLARLLEDAEHAVHLLQTNKVKREIALIECLKTAALLHEHGQDRDPDGYRRLLATHKIKITKRTGNPFTPVVKLVFRALDERERTSLSRYASVLRFAHDAQYMPADFDLLLKKEGGLEGCVKEDRDRYPSPERLTADQKRAEHFRALKAGAQMVEFGAVADKLPNGFTAVLVDKDSKGRVRLLGLKEEKIKNVRSYTAPNDFD